MAACRRPAAPARRYVATTDPELEQKAADVIAVYLDAPEHAVVLGVDEKTAIRALDRVETVLPLSPGRPNVTARVLSREGRLGFEPPFASWTHSAVTR